MLATRAADASCALVYVNQVCGQDELVFDGGSMVFDADGNLVARAAQFVEELMIVDVDIEPVYRKRLLDPRGRRHRSSRCRSLHVSDAAARRSDDRAAGAHGRAAARPDAELYEALVLGTGDYVRKNGFTDVVIGLSGGIDSTHRRVHRRRRARRRPRARRHHASRATAATARKTDAADLADRLGHRLPHDRDRAGVRRVPRHDRASRSRGKPADLTEENLQSRIRGTTLMALSNKFGWMVLTTGNKSEMAVGYFTLYGDSVGGYAVIKDVLKTRVYDLCRYVNARAGREIINESVITKPPSAELRPDQRDDQSLPPYEVLDPILRAVRRGGSHRGRDHRARSRRGDGPPDHPAGRHQRVQAPPVPARRAGQREGVRQGPPPADHQRLPRLTPS